MSLPDSFKWLETIGVLPKMVQEAIKVLGIKEVPGSASNPTILQFAKELGVDDIYKNDDTSWCAVSHNAIALRAGKNVEFADKYDYLRALAFKKQGVEFGVGEWEDVDRKGAMLGDTLCFVRPGGGHIGIYIGESDTHFYVMGGNQNNMYSITRIAKERLDAVRRPKYSAMPESVKKYFLSAAGVPVTENEK